MLLVIKGKRVSLKKLSRRQTLQAVTASAAMVGFPHVVRAASLGLSNRDADVIVIGAGLSGLQAAVLLQDVGVDVLVLEGSERVGGRVYTKDDAPGRPDVGGSEIGTTYARVRDMIDRVGGFTMKPFIDIFQLEFALHIDGSLMPVLDWPQATVNKLPESERNTGPFGPFALGPKYAMRPSPLADLDSWLEPENAKYDIPYGDFLKSQGASDEAIRLISEQLDPGDANGVSTLWIMRSQRFQQFVGGLDGLDQMQDGMSRLPEGMARLLSRDVQFGATIESISYDDQGVEVRDAKGRAYRARYVICTVPLTILKQIQFEPGLPDLQAEAVATIPCDRSAGIYFHVTDPYWEEDGMPGSTWTNHAMGRVFRYSWGDGYYLWMQKGGADAAALSGMSDKDIMEQALKELHDVRPSTVGRVEPTTVMNWGDYPWTQGHNAYRGPGHIAKYGNIIATPHGPIHFCGEHTSVLASGMEGAMESGERAAVEVLEKIDL